jgi:hypothetical protein
MHFTPLRQQKNEEKPASTALLSISRAKSLELLRTSQSGIIPPHRRESVNLVSPPKA